MNNKARENEKEEDGLVAVPEERQSIHDCFAQARVLIRVLQKTLRISFPKEPSGVPNYDVQGGHAAKPVEESQTLAILLSHLFPSLKSGGTISHTGVELFRF
jgi:hypothetical protein